MLEQEVIQAFYTRDGKGIPTAWIKRMRGSMARLTARYSANHTVREYTERRYLPAAAAYRTRAAHKGACGPQILNWRHKLDQHWSALRFGDGKVVTHGEEHIFEVKVHLDYFDPEAERVELLANGVGGDGPHGQEISNIRQLAGSVGGHVYHASVSAARPATDYTARVIPHCDGMAIPLEEAYILWQR